MWLWRCRRWSGVKTKEDLPEGMWGSWERNWGGLTGRVGKERGRGRRRERCRRVSVHCALLLSCGGTATATSCLPGCTCTIWEDASAQMLLYYFMSYLCKGNTYEYIGYLFMSSISILAKMWTSSLFWSQLNVCLMSNVASLHYFFWMAQSSNIMDAFQSKSIIANNGSFSCQNPGEMINEIELNWKGKI